MAMWPDFPLLCDSISEAQDFAENTGSQETDFNGALREGAAGRNPEGKQMACLEQNFEHTHFENQTTAPADDTDTVIRADDSTCQECTYLNYCQLTPNHSGPHMCSQGHRW
ncbi:hypothetical protein [Novosphingobium sp.]|uniref:hypothetical protein n=1 Tax=Sphingomonadales TaxID=204457 RepID=UPI001B6039E0|nr:hypothetical protein [Novosphingobium sp.]MBK8376068.1 hypothetical protein [Sphingomonadales bacterium]MBK9011569.1 hypothetical protein [Novosphingobium sp.]MBP8672155.1 hypothetical protein [Sphingobium sp.]